MARAFALEDKYNEWEVNRIKCFVRVGIEILRGGGDYNKFACSGNYLSLLRASWIK